MNKTGKRISRKNTRHSESYLFGDCLGSMGDMERQALPIWMAKTKRWDFRAENGHVFGAVGMDWPVGQPRDRCRANEANLSIPQCHVYRSSHCIR